MSLCCLCSTGVITFTVFYAYDPASEQSQLQVLGLYCVAEILFKLFQTFEYKLACNDPLIMFTSREIFNCSTIPDCCTPIEYNSQKYGITTDFVVLGGHVILLAILVFITEFYAIIGFRCLRKTTSRRNSQVTIMPSADGGKAMNTLLGNDQEMAMPSTEPSPQSFAAQQQMPSSSSKSEEDHAVVCLNLVYRYKKVEVLKKLNLFLEKTECMNLTGPNNSGKSTLLKVLVGETRLKSGRIWVNGHQMERHPMMCFRLMGYCPQRDSLPLEFTPRELMYIVALFQGLQKGVARELTDSLLRMLGLTHCWNRSLRLCTNGQSRRFNFGLAVLGLPQVVCVDGVPAGLDPTGKRTIFTVTSKMQTLGTSFLYTHLNPLDAERLCQRAPSLHDGQLWMVGSFDDIQKNYRSGYQLEVRFKRKVNPNVSMSRSTWNRINHFPMSPHKKFNAFMEIKFPNATLRREREDSMVFQMPLGTTTFSEIFIILRKDGFEMNVEDYFITRNVRMGVEIFLFDRADKPT
ncbi:hypothetical protein KR009_012303 [Drosophila setifemur]|nr:hypothetical protein KR009_012303 [Drosophila setifemur]